MTELRELIAIEKRLRELIDRHTVPTGEYHVAVAELRNVLVPGSARMYPETPGYAATCSTCAPDGDGKGGRRGEGLTL